VKPPIRAVIVDDEPLARQGLAAHLADRGDVVVVASCADGFEALRAVRDHEPDLVFVDVQMPEMTGFDLVRQIDADAMPAVVFVTAHDEFALEAFEAAAIDYVLKPLEEDRIARAVERARRLMDTPDGTRDALRDLLHRVRERAEPERHASRLKVRSGDHIHFIRVDEVEWFEAEGNYVVLHHGGEEARIRSTLTGLEEALDPDRFVRVHRSVIVNLDHLDEVQPWFSGDYLAIMKSGEQIRVSRRYKDQLLRDVF
jgi:two-component system LytT family response regulator